MMSVVLPDGMLFGLPFRALTTLIAVPMFDRVGVALRLVFATCGLLASPVGWFAAPVLGGYILEWTHGNWNAFLYTMAAVYLLGTICWPFIDPVTPLEQSDRAPAVVQ